MAAESAAYKHCIPGADGFFPGQVSTLEPDAGCIDIDAVAFARVYDFRVAGYEQMRRCP